MQTDFSALMTPFATSPTKLTSPSDPERVDTLLSELAQLTSGETLRFLRKMVRRTARQPGEMLFLRSLVQAVPRCGGLDWLPSEVAAQLLGHLDPLMLGRMACTSRRWARAVLDDARPWKSVFSRLQREGTVSCSSVALVNRLLFQHSSSEQPPSSSSSSSSSSSLFLSPPQNVQPVQQTQMTGTLSAHTQSQSQSQSQSQTHGHRITQPPLPSRVLPFTTALCFEAGLQRNWTAGTTATAPLGVECHGSHVVTCMEIDPSGDMIVTGSDDGTVHLWNAADGREVRVFSGHVGGVWTLRVDWTGGRLVTGSTDRTLILWDLRTGERLCDLLGHTSTVRCVELVGERIVSGSRDGTIRVWSSRSGECLHVLTGHTASVRCLAVFRDTLVVSGSYDHSCRLWDLATGRLVHTLLGHTNKVYAVTATERLVLSGSLDGAVRVWDPHSGACLQVLTGHRALVGLVLAKPTGDVAVSGSTDGSLQLINTAAIGANERGDVSAGDCVSLLSTAHPSSITSLDFNRRFLVTGSEGVVRLWGLPARDSRDLELRLVTNLLEAVDMVWRVAVSDTLVVIAYQLQGQTRMAIFNFAPSPSSVSSDLRASVRKSSRPPVHLHQRPVSSSSSLQAPLFGNVFYSAAAAATESVIRSHRLSSENVLVQPHADHSQHGLGHHGHGQHGHGQHEHSHLHYHAHDYTINVHPACSTMPQTGPNNTSVALHLHPELLALGHASSSLPGPGRLPDRVIVDLEADDLVVYMD